MAPMDRPELNEPPRERPNCGVERVALDPVAPREGERPGLIVPKAPPREGDEIDPRPPPGRELAFGSPSRDDVDGRLSRDEEDGKLGRDDADGRLGRD